ncbi:hypothetical protein F53441_4641 [Fusarium austroafricanum]|uniref:Uncharacterized protein n=1 Tax=Fusarium austroafricanum TaxID=2364996 RepID=A0A8H4KNF4_9HYPO|nr:hypothetical protein F53441_4641 [Fusarium austroafricanum]
MAIVSRHVKLSSMQQLLRTGSAPPSSSPSPLTCTPHAVSTIRTASSNWHQTRSYAAPRGAKKPLRPPPRAPKLVQAHPRSQADARADFNINQISPRDFEQAMRASGSAISTLKPEEYYEYASKFANAISRGAHPQRVSLKENNIPVETAHEMACLLWLIGRTRNFSTAMWSAASESHYNPATVSLAKQLLLGGSWGKTTAFKGIEERFMKLIAEGKDCNALTAYGEHLFEKGEYNAAVGILNQAVSSADDGAFEWKGPCLICLTKSYTKLGKVGEAKKALEALNDPEAYTEFEQLLNSSEAEAARQEMYTTAIRGKHDVYRQLAEFEFEREAKETDAELKRNYNLWGMEWSRLADPSAKF